MLTTVHKYLGIGAALLFVACLFVISSLDLKNDIITAKLENMTYKHDQIKAHGQQLYQIVNLQNETIKKNNRLNARLLKKIETGQHQLTLYKSEFDRRKQDNESLKIWADTNLPLDIVQLHGQPYFNRTEDFEAWLSKRFTLQPAKRKPPDQ